MLWAITCCGWLSITVEAWAVETMWLRSCCSVYWKLDASLIFCLISLTWSEIVKQLLIALFTLATLTTLAEAHGIKNHVCHKHGAYGYHCHP